MSTLSFIANALTPEERELAEQKNMKMLEKLGLPPFHSGIKIVPRALLGLPEEVLKKGADEEKQRKLFGYKKKTRIFLWCC